MNVKTLLVASVAMAILASCQGNTQKKEADTINDDFYADNDIAMVVRSVADAMSLGEPLDSASYAFEGILTDGQGRPLYTDVGGGPGNWLIEVSNPSTLIIRNMSPGNLLPSDLEQYLTSELPMTPVILIDDEYPFDEETRVKTYDFGAGLIRFETRSAITNAGIEGDLLSIVITSNK